MCLTSEGEVPKFRDCGDLILGKSPAPPPRRRVGAVLAVLFVVVGSIATIEEAWRGFDLSGNLERAPPPPGDRDPRASQLGLLFLFFQFAVLVGAALWNRHRRASTSDSC